MWCDPLIVRDWRKHIGYCTPDFWEQNFDWRAAVLERAATRPCTLVSFRHPEFASCRDRWQDFGGTPETVCQSTPPVAR